jgi:hypothetical protein
MQGQDEREREGIIRGGVDVFIERERERKREWKYYSVRERPEVYLFLFGRESALRRTCVGLDSDVE